MTRESRRRRLSQVAGIGLLALVIHNLGWMIYNEITLPCTFKVCTRPRDAAGLAAENRHAIVRGRMAIYHELAERLAGASLIIPPRMVEHEWNLARVSRLRVAIADRPATIDPSQVARLRGSSAAEFRWLHSRSGRGRNRTETWQPFHLITIPGGTRYVLAETTEQLGPLFILPESLYREVAVRSRPAQPKAVVP